MKTQQYKFLHRPLLVGGVAAILVSGIAIASLAISAQSLSGVFLPSKPPEAVAAPASAPLPAVRAHTYLCDGCGVIESMRKMDIPEDNTGARAAGGTAPGKRGAVQAEPLRNYEITIRMQDGSMRVIQDARPAHWRYGEPVIVIAGVD